MLNVTIIARSLLQDTDIQAMLALHRRYFAAVQEATFRRDLAGKDWVILLREADGVLAGFSTQKLITLTEGGRPRRFLFSGDTIVAHQHWRQPGLAGGFGHLMQRLIERHGEGDLYWFLISKGFRTYRFLPVFFNSFYPGPDRSEDERRRYKPLLDLVAARQFGAAYDAASGIVRAGGAADRLRDEWGGVDPYRLNDPHVAFFVRANPGWQGGDELACLAPISGANLNAVARRVIRATAPVWNLAP